jgi:DNA-binding NarL/FixJ family response regulator
VSISPIRRDKNPLWLNAPESPQFGKRDDIAAVREGPNAPAPQCVDPNPTVDAITYLGTRHVGHELLARQCRSRIDGLPPRQREVLAQLVAGHSNKQAARTLGISPRTIEVYRASMMARLKVRTLSQALYIAFMAGFAPPETI